MDKRKILSVLISILLVICVSMTVTFAANENGQSTQDPGNPAADDSGQDGSEGQQPGDENKDDSGTQDEGQEGKTPGSTDDQGSGTDESVPDNTKKDDSGDKDKDKSDDPKDQVRKAAKSSKISKEDEEKAIEFEGQIEQIEREMATIEAKLKELQDKIEKYEKRAGELKKKFTAKQKAMGERLRTIYKTGSAGFADVVLSSDNVSDMMVNVEMVKRIYSSDTQAIESLKEDYKELEKEAKKLKAAKRTEGSPERTTEKNGGTKRHDHSKCLLVRGWCRQLQGRKTPLALSFKSQHIITIRIQELPVPWKGTAQRYRYTYIYRSSYTGSSWRHSDKIDLQLRIRELCYDLARRRSCYFVCAQQQPGGEGRAESKKRSGHSQSRQHRTFDRHTLPFRGAAER